MEWEWGRWECGVAGWAPPGALPGGGVPALLLSCCNTNLAPLVVCDRAASQARTPPNSTHLLSTPAHTYTCTRALQDAVRLFLKRRVLDKLEAAGVPYKVSRGGG